MEPTPTIARLPKDQRPRERLLAHGSDALTDAELVAILLGTGLAGASALELAAVLLRTNGGLGGLRHADVASLARTPGVGAAKAARLVAALGLAARAVDAPDERPVIERSSDIVDVVGPRFVSLRRERLVLMVCGAGNRVIDVAVVADGSAHSAVFPVRELLAEVLRRDGTAFALAHNHPGGDPAPSRLDRATTTAVGKAAASVGLRLLDHVVLAGSRWRSVLASD